MRTTSVVLLVALLAVVSVPLLAAPHECCKRFAHPAQFNSGAFAKALAARVLPATATQVQTGRPACQHHASVERWKEWRARNPGVKGKYEYGPHSVNVFGLSFSPTPMPDDPEPDPSFGCGCTLDVSLASDGCGWLHSQVWSLKSW